MSSENPHGIVFCTCPDSEVAEGIATALVGGRLAACVNIIPGVRSVYRWQGKVERDEELLLVIKTHRNCYARLEAAIRERHPYELPEIVRVPIDTGLPDYLAWVDSSVDLKP